MLEAAVTSTGCLSLVAVRSWPVFQGLPGAPHLVHVSSRVDDAEMTLSICKLRGFASSMCGMSGCGMCGIALWDSVGLYCSALLYTCTLQG